jgi:hypothetical protein
MKCFSPASRIILIESLNFQEKKEVIMECFSPASRIILIERKRKLLILMGQITMFQSRKQDYFN